MPAGASTTGARAPDGTPQPSWLDRLVGAAIWLFALVAVAIFRVVDSTIDLRLSGYHHLAELLRARRAILVVVWHGKGLLPIFFFQGLPLVIYASMARDVAVPRLSRDVRRLTLTALQHLGYRVLDASVFRTESRGVLRFLHLLEAERGGLIAADGPKGPIFRAQPGATYIAKRTGVVLLPVSAAMRDAIALDSWDRFEVPRPFTRASLRIGEPLEVPTDADDAALQALSARLEGVLNLLTVEAERRVVGDVRREEPQAT